MFDEIVTNALDHKVRDAKMTELKISIESDGTIVVYNNGLTCIPTTLWNGTDRHVPEILFTELSAGSNLGAKNSYNVGGRNGVGASITNILSKKFVISIGNVADGVQYDQCFEENAGKIHKRELAVYNKKKSFVSVTFLPDFARINMPTTMSDGVRKLLIGRAVDASASTDATVHVNGTKIAIKTFASYAEAFGGTVLGSDKVKCDEQEAGLGATVIVTTKMDPPLQICFVNGVRCTGTLLNAVLHNLGQALLAKKDALPERQIKNMLSECISVFVTARVNTPNWTGQAKDVLDTPVAKFGFDVPKCKLLAKRIEALDIVKAQVEMRRSLADGKAAKKALRETGGKNTNKIKKYEKATDVGKGKQCTLWIAEGDSAKAMIVAGFQVTGRRHNGVYPLRGKLLNVYDMTAADALKNTEVSELISILHLDPAKTYDTVSAKKLPYHLMVTTDQDDDGSHIFGLVLALFYRFFPSLLAVAPGFVRRFVTPVVKVWPTARAAPLEFFALSAYRAWAATHPNASSVAYYKGLGTNTNEEAIAYFSSMSTYAKTTLHTKACVDAMRVAFAKANAPERRELLRSKTAHDTHDLYSGTSFATSAFCIEELPLFWQADNLRSIPNAIDGLKPSQRKTVYTVLDGAASTKHKVAQLAADVAKKTNYHHGEAAMADVIVKLAQTFFGSNNLPLLIPKGQFGNRHGEKPSQPRYIFTMAQPYLADLFCKADGAILPYLVDEGMQVEPRIFVPTVPLLLINGSEGIGTGFSTSVPSHAVGDVVDRCRTICANGVDTPLDPLLPFHHGFKGSTYVTDTSVEFMGDYDWLNETTVRITELPPGVKTNALKDTLIDLECIDDVVNFSTGENVDLRVQFKTVPSNVEKTLKLKTTVSVANIHAYDATGRLVKFTSTLDILRMHARVRLDFYVERRRCLLEKAQKELGMLEAKIAFVEAVVAGEIDVFHTKRSVLKTLLGENATELLAISLDHLNLDGVAEFKAKMSAKQGEIADITAMTPQTSWLADLDALEKKLSPMERASRAHKRRVGHEEDDAFKCAKVENTAGEAMAVDEAMVGDEATAGKEAE